MTLSTDDLRLARLAEFRIMDTQPDPRFDRITGLVQKLFGAQIALIGLMDDKRQWYKSCIGLNNAEAPIDETFCKHLLASGTSDLLIVEDATKDSRFCENPFVTDEPNIRFYAGAALTTTEGQVIGSICVIGDRPRKVSADEAESLRTFAAMVVDLMELRRASQAADDRARALDLAGRVSRIGAWRLDLATGRPVWSDTVYEIHGVTRDTFDPELGSAIDFYHPDDRPRVYEFLETVKANDGEVQGIEHRLIRADGEVRTVVSRARVERDASGEARAIFGVFQDVTEQARASEQLKRSEALYRLLANNMADVVTCLRPDGASSYISPAVEGLLGYKPEEMLGRQALDYVFADDHDSLREALTQVAATHTDATLKLRALCKDGRVIWVEVALRAVARRSSPLIVAVIRDITERQRLREEVAASERRFRLLTENASDIIACFDRRARFTYLSPAVERVLGYRPEELVGEPTHKIMHPDDYVLSLKTYGEHIVSARADEPFTFEYRAFRKDGTVVWLAAHPRVVRDELGEIVEFHDVVRDITEQKATAEALEAAKLAAEGAAHAKSEFLANMSHELRTPLTSIIGFSGLAAEQADLPPLAANFLGRVKNASRALLSTVNDILDFSKLEAGQVVLCPQPTSLGELMRGVMELFTAQAGAKDLRLDLEFGSGCEDTWLSLDQDRIRQVLLNYMSNAIKFTDHGAVTLKADFDRLTGHLKVEVIDTGAGIPQEKLNLLFQRFSQIDGSLSRKGGTGLGLAICKGLIEAMGGEVGVASEPGVGSRFWFDAPFAIAEKAAPASVERMQVELGGARVLIVDDHPTNRELARLVLSGVGAETLEAADGLEAVSLASQWPVDVILMDIRMPKMGGVEALQTLRAQAGPNDQTPVLAFTADVAEDAASELSRAGFAGLVQKPVNAEELLTAVADAMAFSIESEEVQHVCA